MVNLNSAKIVSYKIVTKNMQNNGYNYNIYFGTLNCISQLESFREQDLRFYSTYFHPIQINFANQ